MKIYLSYNTTKRRYAMEGLCIQCGTKPPAKNRRWCRECLIKSNKSCRSYITMDGRIKTANSRGFGFIETKDGIDYFFHYTAFDGNWKKLLGAVVRGAQIIVKFDVDKTADEPKALNVAIVQVDEN